MVLAQIINIATGKYYPWGWRVSLGLAGIPAIILTIGGIVLPDTPNSLVERGFEEEGRKVNAGASSLLAEPKACQNNRCLLHPYSLLGAASAGTFVSGKHLWRLTHAASCLSASWLGRYSAEWACRQMSEVQALFCHSCGPSQGCPTCPADSKGECMTHA